MPGPAGPKTGLATSAVSANVAGDIVCAVGEAPCRAAEDSSYLSVVARQLPDCHLVVTHPPFVVS